MADFIVLDRNLLDVPIQPVHQTEALKTVLGGEMIFELEGAKED